MRPTLMRLSIVTTLYRSAPYIAEFCARSSVAAAQLAGDDFEIILVNDGSPDDSLAVAVAVAEENPKVTVVDLSRNFGHWKAMRAGLGLARGALVYMTDSDLEEEPELLLVLEQARQEAKAQVAYATQAKRRGGLFERLSGAAFYKIYNALADTPMPRNFMTSRVMTRTYVDAVLSYDETNFFFPGLLVHAGFKQVGLACRKHGGSPTTYNFARKLALAVEALTSFSAKPLVYVFWLGCAMTSFALAFTIYVVLQKLMVKEYAAGWSSVIASVWLLGGILIFCLGVIGIYLSKIFAEVKARPKSLVRFVYRHGDCAGEV